MREYVKHNFRNCQMSLVFADVYKKCQSRQSLNLNKVQHQYFRMTNKILLK